MARYTLYTPRDPYRRLGSVRLISDQDIPAGLNNYLFRVGIASSRGVDYYGTFDGSEQKITKNVPYLLADSPGEKIGEDELVVLDVNTRGLPQDLGGTTVQVEIEHTLREPGHRVRDHAVAEAIDGLASHLTNTRSGDEVICIALPRNVDEVLSRDAQHEETTDTQNVSSPTFVNGLVSLAVNGSGARPTMVFVTASATFRGQSGADTLYVAVGDGTVDWCPNGQYVRAGDADDVANVVTHFAAQVTQPQIYTLRVRTAQGNPLTLNQAISAISVEL